jgi:Triose-phosphate Transporter family
VQEEGSGGRKERRNQTHQKGKEKVMKGKEREPSSPPMDMSYVAKLVLVICSYLVIGPSLILLNDSILKDDFPYPFFLAMCGVFFTLIFTTSSVALGFVHLEARPAMSSPSSYLYKVMPVGFFTCSSLVFGNIVYLYLSVSFIQMLKAFTPAIALVVSYLFGLEPAVSRKLVFSVLGLSIGTCVAAFGEVNFSIIGVLFMLMSQLSEVLRLVMMQVLLCKQNFTVFEGLYYLTPAAFFWLILAVLVFESQTMVNRGAIRYVYHNADYFLLCGCLGLGITFVSFYVLQLTSSVSLKALALGRNAGLVLFCGFFWGEILAPVELVGYFFSLSCFGWYNQIRIEEKLMEEAKEKKLSDS